MYRKFIFALITFHLALGETARSAEVNGVVSSYTTRKPLKGVTVSVKPSLQGMKPVYTGADGIYHIAGLPPGRYTVEFELVSYQLRPERRDIRFAMTTDKVGCDVILKPEDIGGRAAAQQAAATFREEAQRNGGERADYVRQWQRLRTGTLSFEEKLAFAEALSEDNKARDYLPLREYLDAPKNELLPSFSKQLYEALTERKSLPEPDVIKHLGPDLTADLVLFQLRTADVDPEWKSNVAAEITTKWKGLTPANVVNVHYMLRQRTETRPP